MQSSDFTKQCTKNYCMSGFQTMEKVPSTNPDLALFNYFKLSSVAKIKCLWPCSCMSAYKKLFGMHVMSSENAKCWWFFGHEDQLKRLAWRLTLLINGKVAHSWPISALFIAQSIT